MDRAWYCYLSEDCRLRIKINTNGTMDVRHQYLIKPECNDVAERWEDGSEMTASFCEG